MLISESWGSRLTDSGFGGSGSRKLSLYNRNIDLVMQIHPWPMANGG